MWWARLPRPGVLGDRSVWGHGGDTLGTATRDWFAPDGTRSAVAAINTEPDLRQDPSVPAFGQFAQAEGTLVEQMVCQMYGKPVPTPSTSTAATRSFAPTPMDLPWRELTGLNTPPIPGN